MGRFRAAAAFNCDDSPNNQREQHEHAFHGSGLAAIKKTGAIGEDSAHAKAAAAYRAETNINPQTPSPRVGGDDLPGRSGLACDRFRKVPEDVAWVIERVVRSRKKRCRASRKSAALQDS